MFDFPALLKTIRKEIKVTQQEFADTLGVSKNLIVKLETQVKEPSKKFINTLADKLKIHSDVLMLYLSSETLEDKAELTPTEKKLMNIGLTLQKRLIKKHAQYLVSTP